MENKMERTVRAYADDIIECKKCGNKNDFEIIMNECCVDGFVLNDACTITITSDKLIRKTQLKIQDLIGKGGILYNSEEFKNLVKDLAVTTISVTIPGSGIAFSLLKISEDSIELIGIHQKI